MTKLHVSEVDKFLASNDKDLANEHPWPADHTTLSWRWTKKEILLDGSYSGFYLAVVYPKLQPSREFGLLIVAPEMIWRVDHWPTSEQFNDFASPTGVPPGRISGPLYYRWEDNRHLMQDGVDPAKFRYARPLPDDIRGYRAALQWFLLETRISVPLRWLRLSEQNFQRISGAPAGFRLPRSAEAG
jgi:hypothetical protein